MKNVVLGQYKATVVTIGSLVKVHTVTLSKTVTEIAMGELQSGNPNDDTSISGSDFSMLLSDYLATAEDDKWNNGRCDFDCDGQVTCLDYSTMMMNYGKVSPLPVEE